MWSNLFYTNLYKLILPQWFLGIENIQSSEKTKSEKEKVNKTKDLHRPKIRKKTNVILLLYGIRAQGIAKYSTRWDKNVWMRIHRLNL